ATIPDLQDVEGALLVEDSNWSVLVAHNQSVPAATRPAGLAHRCTDLNVWGVNMERGGDRHELAGNSRLQVVPVGVQPCAELRLIHPALGVVCEMILEQHPRVRRGACGWSGRRHRSGNWTRSICRGWSCDGRCL